MDDKNYYKCPILQMKNVGQNRQLACINCPVSICYEEMPEKRSGKKPLPLFLEEVQATIAELRDIESYIEELLKPKAS